MTKYQKIGKHRSASGTEKEFLAEGSMLMHSKHGEKPSVETNAGNLAVQRASTTEKSQESAAEVEGEQIFATVYPASEESNPAIIWRNESGAIVAIVEFDTNESLNKYLKKEVTLKQLIEERRAAIPPMSVYKNVDLLPIPTVEPNLIPPEPAEEEKRPPKPEHKPEKKSFFEGIIEDIKSTAADIVEDIRTYFDRRRIRSLLNDAAEKMMKGEDCDEIMKKAADEAIDILNRKISGFDPDTAKEGTTKELLRTVADVMTLSSEEQQTDKAWQLASSWAHHRLVGALNEFKDNPTEDNAKDMLNKVATAQLLGADSDEEHEATELFMAYYEGEKQFKESSLKERIFRFFGL